MRCVFCMAVTYAGLWYLEVPVPYLEGPLPMLDWQAATAWPPSLEFRWHQGEPVAVADSKTDVDHATLRARAWDRIKGRLAKADEASLQLALGQVNRVEKFFTARKQQSYGFAEEVLSLDGKFELLKNKLGFSEDEDYERYLHRCFERHLFSARELEELLESVSASYVTKLAGLENELLLAVRADLSDREFQPLGLPQTIRSAEAFRREYARLIEEVVRSAGDELRVALTREAVSFAAAEIATVVTMRVMGAVAVRLGIHSGILGVGAGSGVVTFGVGLAVSVVIDRIIDWALRQFGYDPGAVIAEQVRASLTKIEDLVLDGDPATEGQARSGLCAELKRLSETRAHLRKEALRRFVFGAAAP